MIEQLKTFWAEKKYRIGFLAVLLVAFGMRINMLFGPLEYDEIWTLGYVQNSVAKIFADLATPNNHPLNTFFVKLWWNAFGIPQLIRLHSLVFGMLSVALTGMLALGLFRSRAAALMSMVFIAFDAAAVYYSDQARGYSTQLFFLLCFACGLVWSGRLRRFLPWKLLPEAAMILGAAGAVLTVPTAPIFLAAMLVAGRVCRRKIPEASVLIVIGLSWVFVAAYLGLNHAALQEARSRFGVRFTDFSQWRGFLFMILQDFFALAVVPFLLVLLATDRRRGMLLGLCALVIVGSAAFASAGPSRVYLPLCALVALGCGRGAHALMTVALCNNNRKLVRILVVTTVFLAAFGGYQLYDTWHIVDYIGWFKAGQRQPPDYLSVYPATRSYPVWWNNSAELEKDQEARLGFAGPGMRRMLCFGVEPGTINGMTGDGGEAARKLKVRGQPKRVAGFPAVEYRLAPAETLRPGEPFIAVIPPLEEETRQRAWQALADPAPQNLLILNPHFRPGNLIYGEAPERTELWEELRKAGVTAYSFVPDDAL